MSIRYDSHFNFMPNSSEALYNRDKMVKNDSACTITDSAKIDSTITSIKTK